METLYVFRNKSYHYPLFKVIFEGMQELPTMLKMHDAIVVWCPADPEQTYVLPDINDIYEESGYLKEEYAGRTCFVH